MEAIWGVVRTVLAATLGGWAVKQGYVNGDDMNAMLGAAGVIIVGIWSAVQKVQAGKKLASAQTAAAVLATEPTTVVVTPPAPPKG